MPVLHLFVGGAQARLASSCGNTHGVERWLAHSGRPQASGLCQPRRRVMARALAESDHSEEAAAAAAASASKPPAEGGAASATRLQQTMADLDAMLGIQPEAEEQPKAAQQQAEDVKISVSPAVIAALAEAEARRAEGQGAAQSNEELQTRVRDSIERIVEQARKLAEEEGEAGSGDPGSAGDRAIRNELASLVNAVAGSAVGVSTEDLKKIKEQAFGPSSFWITEVRIMPQLSGGVLLRGNLRRQRAGGALQQQQQQAEPDEDNSAAGAVFEEVCAKVAELCGDKYVVQLLPDPDSLLVGMDDSSSSAAAGGSNPRLAFAILPAPVALPPPVGGWQRLASGALLLLGVGSTLQFGLSASIGLLPAETLAWLAAGGGGATGAGEVLLPPGLETYDPLPFFSATASVLLLTLLPQLAHEAGHAVVAALNGMKLAPPLLVPYGQLGIFGGVTQLKSMARNRRVLFDFASAGLLAGGAASLALFLAGLQASHGGAVPEPGLLPVPTQLLQGSLLLGTLARLGLDPASLTHPMLYVSPMLIGGWCGLVATALNALPVGNLDGGRVFLSAYGRGALSASSVLCYLGLGLGLLGSSLALPFGLYVLICQRTAERYLQDEVSGVGRNRRSLAIALSVFAFITLLPMVGAGDSVGGLTSMSVLESMANGGGGPPNML